MADTLLTKQTPKILGKLPGGIEQRDLWPSEVEYFRANPHVAGMAAADNRVIISPFTKLSEAERRQVALNEAVRVFLRTNKIDPGFTLTPEQAKNFASYGSPEDQRATVAARIYSGDPSAGAVTSEQKRFIQSLRKRLEGQ